MSVPKNTIKHRPVNKCRKWLIQELVTDKWKPGEKMPSQRQLAKVMGCSQLTVNRAMSDLNSRGYAIQKHGSGTYATDSFMKDDPQAVSIYVNDMSSSLKCILSELLIEEGLTFHEEGNISNADIVFLGGLSWYWQRSELLDIHRVANPGSVINDVIKNCHLKHGLGINDRWYGVPVYYTPYLLFCRNDMFKQAGVEVFSQPPDWNSFTQRVSTITDVDSGKHGFGWQAFVTSALPYLWQCGGGLLENGAGGKLKSIVNRKGTIKALKTWKELGSLSGFTTTDRKVPYEKAMTAYKQFFSGDTAMIMNTSVLAKTLSEMNAFEWSVHPLPTLGNHVTGGSATLAAIGREASKPKIGLKIIEKLLSPDWQQRLTTRLFVAPAQKGELMPVIDESTSKLLHLIRNETSHMQFDYFIPNHEIYRLIYGIFVNYWDNEDDLQTVCSRFEELVSTFNAGQNIASFTAHDVHFGTGMAVEQ